MAENNWKRHKTNCRNEQFMYLHGTDSGVVKGTMVDTEEGLIRTSNNKTKDKILQTLLARLV